MIEQETDSIFYESALQRARSFTGHRNGDWEPYVTTFSDLKIPQMSFCLVPVGAFNMGGGDYTNQKPAHERRMVQPYWIAQYPVTNAQWQQAVSAGAVKSPPDTMWYNDPAMADAPVVGVNWFMARDFATWLGCRLPNELEWEYAARGPDSLSYPWGNDWWEDVSIWSANSEKKPSVVMTKPEGKSWVGTAHMSGNVWEWTSSLYQHYIYAAENGIEGGTGMPAERVLRGGSWQVDLTEVLCASYRTHFFSQYRAYDLGFRCARSC